MLDPAPHSEKDLNENTVIETSNSGQRLYARPIKNILDRNSREVVGWLYRWNNGELVPMWKDGSKSEIDYA